MKPALLLGDPIVGPPPHVGLVPATEIKLTVNGQPVACVGDSGICFEHPFSLVEGSKLTVSGRPVAVSGTVSCGGEALSTQSKLFV